MTTLLRQIRTISHSVGRGFSAFGRALTFKHNDGTRRVLVVTIASAFVAAFALPGYAFVDVHTAVDAEGQQVVSAASADTTVELSSFKITSAAALARQGINISYPSYSGPSVNDFLKNPPYPDFSLDKVVTVAQKYLGTPYRFGGASPAGFDCSGYVQFVYAQFGVALPHSVSGQAALGQPIALADARPGDLVIMPGHNGFYMGNGQIMDAPLAGGVISIRSIWTTNYYIVRLGI